MTPEEIAECRAARDRFLAGSPAQALLADVLSTLLEHIDSQDKEITRANHRYADLQNICDDQDKEIKRLEKDLIDREQAYVASFSRANAMIERRNKMIEKQRLALKKLGEKVRAKHRAWWEEQHWHDIDLGRVKRLEDALVEGRAYTLSCNVLESMGVDDTFREMAREQLRAEGVIR